MEQVEYIEIPESWTDTDSLLTSSLSSGNTYQLEARGGAVLIQEASSKPGDSDLGGVLLDGDGQKTIQYTVGSNNLYARGLSKGAHLNFVDVTPAGS